MQKILKVGTYNDITIDKFNEKYLNNGWVIKEVINFNKETYNYY